MCFRHPKYYRPQERYPGSLVPTPPLLCRIRTRLVCFLLGHQWQRHVWTEHPQPLYCVRCWLFYEESPCIRRDSRYDYSL